MRLIRARRRPRAADFHAPPIIRWIDERPSVNAPLGRRCGPLVRRISAMGISGPVERKPLCDQPRAHVGAGNGAGRDRAPGAIGPGRRARHRPLGDPVSSRKRQRRPVAAPVCLTVCTAPQLAALGRGDPGKPNVGAVDFECVAIDYRGSADKGRRLMPVPWPGPPHATAARIMVACLRGFLIRCPCCCWQSRVAPARRPAPVQALPRATAGR